MTILLDPPPVPLGVDRPQSAESSTPALFRRSGFDSGASEGESDTFPHPTCPDAPASMCVDSVPSVAVEESTTVSKPSKRRRRRHKVKARNRAWRKPGQQKHTVHVYFDDAGWVLVENAAKLLGVTPGRFIDAAAVAAARPIIEAALAGLPLPPIGSK